jgi:hypothetical protein
LGEKIKKREKRKRGNVKKKGEKTKDKGEMKLTR